MKKITLLISAILLTVYTNAQCNEPTNVQLYNDYYDLYITWDANGEDLWDVEYGEMGFSPTGIPTNENLAYHHFNFYNMNEPATYIDFYVRADCDLETSNWVGPFTFFNHCFQNVDLAYIIEEDFEDGFLPECWTESNQGTPDTGIEIFGESFWELSDFANNSTNSLSAKINISGTDTNDWLVLPAMQGYEGMKNRDESDLIMNFDIALTQTNTTLVSVLGSDDVVKLVISPDLGVTWFTIRTWDKDSNISNTGEQVNIVYQDYIDGFGLKEKVFLVAIWASSGTINDSENIDFFIDNVYAEPPVTGSVNDLESKGFTYYPNPSDNTINISAKEPISKVVIYNNLGQILKAVSINASSQQLDVSDLPMGVYFMHVTIGNTIGVVSVVKN